jgi:EAL domain-containing protein (putative c-di-GMP-specific phosphodiesterase class I)
MSTSGNAGLDVTYQPIVDVRRGTVAGYQTRAHVVARREGAPDAQTSSTAPGADPDGTLTASVAVTALAAVPTLPVNTFLTIPIAAHVAATPPVRRVLLGRPSLSGIVLDIVGPAGSASDADTIGVMERYRGLGALISVGGYGAAQPELTSIVRLSPSILRLGRDWVRGIDQSDTKQATVEVIGALAGQLDAWILAEGVCAASELRALASLNVPLAQGPFIGGPQHVWPELELNARAVLPKVTPHSDGVLRNLLQQAYTATDAAAAAAVLPETTGFDVVVVLDDHQRPLTLLEQGSAAAWDASDVLAINVDTPVNDVVRRAMTRPRMTRFTPLVCTDDAGKFLGILRIERLMDHLADQTDPDG